MYLILAKNRKNPALQLIHSEFCKWLYSQTGVVLGLHSRDKHVLGELARTAKNLVSRPAGRGVARHPLGS